MRVETRSRLTALAGLLVLMACAKSDPSGDTGSSVPPVEGSSLSAYLAERAGVERFSAVVLVRRGTEVVLREAHGLAERELGTPLAAEHVLPIGSLTKPITAVAALRLAERGELDLERGLCDYLPGCPDEWSRVRLTHLLTHTSGIPDLFNDVECAPVADTGAEIEATIAAAAAATPADTALDFEPGEGFQYNNFGYLLLAYSMELATGELWEDLLRREVFDPLGMRHSRYNDVYALVDGRARGYELEDGKVVNIEYDDHCAYAAGGLESTVDDLATFLTAAHDGTLLSEESRAAAFRPIGGDFYGYGWAVDRALGRAVHNHTGGIGGFSSHFAFYPAEELSIVVLSNLQEENTNGTACDLAALYFGEDWVPMGRFPERPPEDSWAGLAGVYVSSESGYEISEADGDLYYSRDGGRSRQLVFVDTDLFALHRAEQVRLRFDREDGGTVQGMTVFRCGEEDGEALRR